MAIYVNTNVSSIIAQNQLSKNTSSVESTMKKLSTGLRINQAKDDAAGLAISESIKAQIRSNTQAISNIQNGLNMIATAEGGTSSATEDILRIRELCIQAANEIYDDEKKQAIMNEIKQRIENIDVSAESTTFAGKKMLNGSLTSLTIQTGANSNKQINTIDIGPSMTNIHTSAGALDIHLEIIGIATTPSGNQINGANWTGDDIRAYLDKLDAALDKITFDRSMMGAYSNRMEAISNNMTTMNENFEQTKSNITDVDVAQASSNLVKYQILQQSSASALMNSNQFPQIALQLLQQ